MATLLAAHKQWATRPPDERFQSLEDMHRQVLAYNAQSVERADIPWSDLKVSSLDDDVVLIGSGGVPARLTNWSFGQLANLAGAPAAYLRELPAWLAETNLNHGMAGRTGSDVTNLLLHTSDDADLTVRSINSSRYSRIWNHEITERLIDMQDLGWEPAIPDIVSDDMSPSLYASDHDMFVFLRSRDLTVEEKGNNNAVYRGVIVENSEVGASALKLTRFLYRKLCCNRIIWDASRIVDLSIRHVGNVSQRVSEFTMTLRQWAEESATDENAVIARAQQTVIAATKEEVLDAVFGKRSVGLSRKTIESGYDAAVADQDGDPRTVWGLVNGLTRWSQTIPFADKRTDLERSAGKILAMKF